VAFCAEHQVLAGARACAPGEVVVGLFHGALSASFGILQAGQLGIFPRLAFELRLLESREQQHRSPKCHHIAVDLFHELRCCPGVFRN
jgi:hypothetical protein